MIPASHFLDNGDGTLWLVFDPMRLGPWPDFDRPCDRCAQDFTNMVTRETHDCINGRHTFTVEVGTYTPNGIPDDPSIAIYCERRRVSVVPGMVLPIVENAEWDGTTSPIICRSTFDRDYFLRLPLPSHNEHITLPPAAKPGMWAVQLQVHQNGETND